MHSFSPGYKVYAIHFINILHPFPEAYQKQMLFSGQDQGREITGFDMINCFIIQKSDRMEKEGRSIRDRAC